MLHSFSERLVVIITVFQMEGLRNKSFSQRHRVVSSDFFLELLKAPSKEPNPHRFKQELSFGIAMPGELLAKTSILTLDIGHLDPKQNKNEVLVILL